MKKMWENACHVMSILNNNDNNNTALNINEDDDNEDDDIKIKSETKPAIPSLGSIFSNNTNNRPLNTNNNNNQSSEVGMQLGINDDDLYQDYLPELVEQSTLNNCMFNKFIFRYLKCIQIIIYIQIYMKIILPTRYSML